MTDQTTEDTAAYCTCSAMRAIVDHHLKPMSAENTKLAAALTEAEAERESDPVVLDLRARLAETRAENTRLHTWDGLMSLLDEHWPEDLYPTREDGGDRDLGPRIVSLLRWNARLRIRLDEARERYDAEEVIVEGYVHRRSHLPAILANYMDSSAEHAREAKALATKLAEARELARRWQRDAHKHREIAVSRPGLTQIERAQTRQAATEIEQCSRQLVAEIGPDPAERVETTTHADPEPHGLAAIRDRVKRDPILTEAEIDGASSGWIELMQARRDRAELLSALDTELDEQTHPATFRETGENLNVRADVQGNLSAAPLTLAQAATALHDWAGDLDDGARTDWPAGHPDIIRGIRAAADWLDARATYETETREQMRALVDRHGMADRTCLIGDDTRTPDAAVDAVVTILDRVVSGHLDDRDREGEDWSGPHPISIESDARRIIAAVQPHLIATAREAEEAPEPAEPTLRDVMAAAYRAGLGLHLDEDVWQRDDQDEEWKHREWSITNRHGRGVGRLAIDTGDCFQRVELSDRRGRPAPVSLVDPTAGEVLAAARLAGLIGDES